jgi:acetolactate synthase-1/2/3 large subunit
MIAAGYGVKSCRISTADELEQQLAIAVESNEPFLIDCPMENIPVPTPGIWNINDIYTKKPNVINGRLIFDDEK